MSEASQSGRAPVVIVGAGFSGLSAAYELARNNIPTVLVDPDTEVGGLAGSFDVDGVPLEKFYHHWFRSDVDIHRLVAELGAEDNIVYRPTVTGMYHAKSFYRLSGPLDVLRFSALSFVDRIRLGLLVLKARKVTDWRELESRTAKDWLIELGGPEVYRVVWEPLLKGKFGEYAEQVSAVWFWNKLVLRGGSRGKGHKEELAYYRGGFAALAQQVRETIEGHGGSFRLGRSVTGLLREGSRVTGVTLDNGERIDAAEVIVTTATPIASGLLEGHVPADYLERIDRIEYLANICLVLQLDRSLSDTYWLNVADPSFPFVGIIEHTCFEPPESYGGRHIVYLSKYLPPTAELYRMDDADVLDFALPHVQRMFPAFDRSWIRDHHVWRARYAQPVVCKHYSEIMPPMQTPLENVSLATMAQVYPEDRGTNYAVRMGREAGKRVAERLEQQPTTRAEASRAV